MFFLLVLISLFNGCSNDNLTRGKAEMLIRELKNFPYYEIKRFETSFPRHSATSTIDKLQSEELITYHEYFTGLGGYWISVGLTEKGKQYASSDEKGDSFERYIDVKVATLDFGEVTGILYQKELNTATVNYTYIRKDLTPFGKIAFNLTEGPITETHTFTKYDNGWRITE